MSETLVELKEIAEILLISPRRVQQLAKEGTIPKANRGKYPLVACIQGYVKYLQSMAYGAEGAEQSGYGQARTDLTRIRAEMQEMKLRQMRQELLPAQEVEAAWAVMVMHMKSKLQSIPSKAAPRVRATRTNAEAQALLKKLVDESLNELKETEIQIDNIA